MTTYACPGADHEAPKVALNTVYKTELLYDLDAITCEFTVNAFSECEINSVGPSA